MTAGLGMLRLAPDDFWSMTPRELDAALRGAFGIAMRHEAPSRHELLPPFGGANRGDAQSRSDARPTESLDGIS
jgi:uncharacterized phage protein (TIGR02216 family)